MKSEVIFSLFVGIAISIGGAYFFKDKVSTHNGCKCVEAHQKSKLKQIGTSVAIYFTDSDDQNFPASPQLFNFHSKIIENSPHKTWSSMNLKSQYFFFVHEGKNYTGKNDQVLVVAKEPIEKSHKHFVLYEDGHVEVISSEKTKQLIEAFEKQRRSK
ncbi:MAG: hypothetical protein NE327_06770 [Lentisphaeraceae bacterium]|nr:hypothetical protein [Lentisphaeraceae bacterium]